MKRGIWKEGQDKAGIERERWNGAARQDNGSVKGSSAKTETRTKTQTHRERNTQGDT